MSAPGSCDGEGDEEEGQDRNLFNFLPGCNMLDEVPDIAIGVARNITFENLQRTFTFAARCDFGSSTAFDTTVETLQDVAMKTRDHRKPVTALGFVLPVVLMVPFLLLVFGSHSLHACDGTADPAQTPVDLSAALELYCLWWGVGMTGAFVAAVLVLPERSYEMCLVLLYVFAGMVSCVMYISSMLRRGCLGVENNTLINSGEFVWIVSQAVLNRVIGMRVRVLEVTLWRDFGSRNMFRICACMVVSGLISLIKIPSDDGIKGSVRHQLAIASWVVAHVSILILHVLSSSLAIRAFIWPYMCAVALEKEADIEAARQTVAWARKTARRQLIGVVGSAISGCLTIFFTCFAFIVKDHVTSLPPSFYCVYGLVLLADIMSGSILALHSSGVITMWWQAYDPAIAAAQRGRKERRDAVMRNWQTSSAAEEGKDPLWWDKVRELSERAFSLQSLLLFYEGLGRDYMLDYDSTRHTTNDVVRQAIIPLSKEQRCAYASVMMKGQPTRPQCMVTHNWGNLFRDLVAAIISDALGSTEFGMIADLMDWEMDVVSEMVRLSGKLEQTYWVCAFSVSQHDGICAGNPGHSIDSVTGEEFQLCNCGKPKHFNSCPPLASNGQSINCEMNKFDDMMGFLAATDKDFVQVVAVDAEYVLFTRAWCVAELAEAHQMGMVQRLKVVSADSITRKEGLLRSLQVENMKASRPEDTIDILAKIPDKKAFDKALQQLIFGGNGLIASWRDLDGEQQVSRMGQCLRWSDARTGAQGTRTSSWVEELETGRQQTKEDNHGSSLVARISNRLFFGGTRKQARRLASARGLRRSHATLG